MFRKTIIKIWFDFQVHIISKVVAPWWLFVFELQQSKKIDFIKIY